ncbi:MAG: tRNA preQ1(34) S-adenosylmethionine ribosyltransferase-isomerase QueA [Spirochaetaceae bacterium]|jgi:S-adenosylmethionine:tRNA ribosyltransferase-isomerase|nr:tRNA preQ1(34) S-adenosylmethionine ribosyltransferase-isomerase QueA [Spirochaetaceae bacterium]
MDRTKFSFNVPERLIAQQPTAHRGQSRLMLLERSSGAISHHSVMNLPQLLSSGSVLVFNNSKVRKARLKARTETGTVVEFLLVKKVLDTIWHVLVHHSKRRKPGSRYIFAEGLIGTLGDKIDEAYRLLSFDKPISDEWLDRHGHLPLPPYIKRPDTQTDVERYQTVYADKLGSAAAPTAGLHFSRHLLNELRACGMETAFITLHVGTGTFLPVRTQEIEEHRMHEECFFIDHTAAAAVERAKSSGRAVVAVGTTSVRTLESAWKNGGLMRGEGSTSLFMYPGYRFQLVDALFTNFHMPESTLLMLVSAFAGREFILQAYDEAIRAEYRFFSYGDAMLIV